MMPLNPVGGLRRLKNDSHDVAKVEVTVAAGDELEVSEEVAAQLVVQGNFRDPAGVATPGPQIVKDANGEIDVDATSERALRAAGIVRPSILSADEARALEGLPVKAVKKAAAKKTPAKKAVE